MRRSLEIIALGIGAAIVYGIAHDQITARICIKYFTVGHPDVFGTDSPTLLGLGWGIRATWWVGLFLGCLLALAARFGSPPKLGARDLLRPVALFMLGCGCVALLSGLCGYVLAQQGLISLRESLASRVPVAHHTVFLTDLWAHNGSYLSGFLGGGILAISICVKRGKLHHARLRDRDTVPLGNFPA